MAIARAMMKKPEIYVFDDSFSALDMKTDYRFRQNLKKTMGDADMILYMEEGNIKEGGSHEELMEKDGRYAALYRSQFQ